MAKPKPASERTPAAESEAGRAAAPSATGSAVPAESAIEHTAPTESATANGADAAALDAAIPPAAKDVAAADGGTASGATPDVAAVADGEDVAPATARSAFEAALERKKAAGQARSAHLNGGAKVGGATASHKTSRQFRRKSG